MVDAEQLAALVPAPSSTPDWAALLAGVPGLKALAGTPQNPQYHGEGDVLIHTRMVCEAILALPDYAHADMDRRFVLFYAALLHDIAKPACTVQEGGRISSAGHSRRGAVDARILLWRAGVPFAQREAICRLVAGHQLPFYAFEQNRAGWSPEFLVRRLSWELNIQYLALLAEADARGRICADNSHTLDNIELFRELAREEGCFDRPRAFPDDHTRLRYFRTEGTISPDYAVYREETGAVVTVLSGLPASGKDTWAAAHAKSLPVISFDDAREELGLKHGPGAGAAVHLATDRARALLRQKAPFVWNATHLSGQMRKKTLDLLYAYGAEVEIVYLEQPEAVIKARNSKRDNTLTNAAIDGMLCRWEVPTPTEAHAVRYEAATPGQNACVPAGMGGAPMR